MVFCNPWMEEEPKVEVKVTILILIDGFLQFWLIIFQLAMQYKVTILILIDGFLQLIWSSSSYSISIVTILILIDGFLQYEYINNSNEIIASHNPYFNRWFSAMEASQGLYKAFIESQSLF